MILLFLNLYSFHEDPKCGCKSCQW